MDTPNTEIMRARVDIFVLNAVGKNDGYGYDILNHIQTITQGHYEMKQSSVYNVLKRLENQGYITSYMGNESNGGKRRYYSLTDAGKDFLENEKKEWEYSRTLIDSLVSDREFDLQNEAPPFSPSDLRPLTPRKPKNQPIAEDVPAQTMADSCVYDEETEPEMPDMLSNEPILSRAGKPSDRENILRQSEAANVLFGTRPQISVNDGEIIYENEALGQPAPKGTMFAETAASAVNAVKEEEEDYRGLFDEIFARNSKKEPIRDTDTTVDCRHINDLKQLLHKEGHRLNTYVPSSNKNFMRYVFTAKLYRDTSLLSYLFLVLMLLVVYLAKGTFLPSGAALLSVGSVAVIFPAAFVVQYFANPSKKKKDNVRLNVVLPISVVVYLGFLVLSVIIGLLIPNGYSINSPQLYSPAIVALVVPFAGIIFTVLYKTGMYHQKIK